jgi:hypothetical protein
VCFKGFHLHNSIHSPADRFSGATAMGATGSERFLQRGGQAAVTLVKHCTQFFIHYYALKTLVSW